MIAIAVILAIPTSMVIASYFLDPDTQEWKNPFKRDKD